MKLVSVIIPVYRVEAYIQSTVQSVLNQTYQHFEILIIDDESPDNSLEICQQFQDPRIKIIRQKNQGVSAARNQGIRIANGEFLAFLDGDDLWLPEKLEKHIKHLESLANLGISFSRFGFINQASEFLGIFKMSKIKKITPELILCRNPVGNPSCVVVRKKAIEAIKFFKIEENNSYINCYFDEELNHFEDVELWLRIALKSDWKIAGISEALTLYRINLEGSSVNFNKQLDGLSKMLIKVSIYAPDLSQQYSKLLKAYALRKFTQWAVRQREALAAKKMIYEALATNWKIIIEEPLRTLIILGAIYSLTFLPRPLYLKLETFAFKLTGFIQKIILCKSQFKINQ